MVVLVLMWGYSWVVSKIGLQYANPLDFVVIRLLLGGSFLFLVMLWTRTPLAITHLKGTILIGLIQTSGFLLLNTWALSGGGAGKTSVLVFTMPFWVLVFGWPVLGEKIRGAQWIAVLLALAGLLFLLEPWDLRTTILSKLLAIGAGICWAFGVVYAKKMHNEGPVDALSFSFWQLVIGTVPVLLLDVAVDTAPVQWTGTFVACALFGGVIATGGGWLMWIYVLHRLPAGTTSLSSLGIPVIAVFGSRLQLGEEPGRAELVGMLLIALALAVISWLAIRRHEPTEPMMAQE
jgi:drug/metabolite transporter (DMT)-like permease